ncbi:MAG TPA: DUF1345 domain-containing protein [Candidatus Lustribacter sp.]|jgi:uncharacterized membrane protein|nr:DUF1345 domain-containing protein [Candidatus Lustribacter sp.]
MTAVPLARRRHLWFAPLASVVVLGALALTSAERYRFAHQTVFTAEYTATVLVAAAICWLERPGSNGAPRWVLALVPIMLTAIDIASLLLLVSLVRPGGAQIVGWNLLVTAFVTWALNVATFALWYWLFDFAWLPLEAEHELAFPGRHSETDGISAFIDYIYVAVNTSLAFSPTDVAPVTTRMRFVMLCNATMAFVIVVLAAARAVNVM